MKISLLFYHPKLEHDASLAAKNSAQAASAPTTVHTDETEWPPQEGQATWPHEKRRTQHTHLRRASKRSRTPAPPSDSNVMDQLALEYFFLPTTSVTQQARQRDKNEMKEGVGVKQTNTQNTRAST